MRAFRKALALVCAAGFVILTTLAILGALAVLFGALAGLERVKTIGAAVSGFSAFAILASTLYFSEWISAVFGPAFMGAPSSPPDQAPEAPVPPGSASRAARLPEWAECPCRSGVERAELLPAASVTTKSQAAARRGHEELRQSTRPQDADESL